MLVEKLYVFIFIQFPVKPNAHSLTQKLLKKGTDYQKNFKNSEISFRNFCFEQFKWNLSFEFRMNTN